MAENGGELEEWNVQDAEGKVERVATRAREQRSARAKDRAEEGHLPTPPPDPWLPSPSAGGVHGQSTVKRPRSLEVEDDIIAYLSDFGSSPFEGQTSECPSRNSAASVMASGNIYNDDTFEHLDRLYALTEQVLELRTRSSKFFKRVRDLERLKVLRSSHRKLENAFARDRDSICSYYEEDTGFAESLLDAMLSNCREPQFQRRNLRSPSSRQRSRSLALSEQPLPRLSSPTSRSDVEKRVLRSNAPKVSKWTRVKAAFKWERACTNDAVDISDSTGTPATPTTKYLRIPEVGGGNWTGSTLSPSTSEVSGPSTPLGRVSSASSSNEGSYDGPQKSVANHVDRQSIKGKVQTKNEATSRRSRSLDYDVILTVAAGDAEHSSEMDHGKPLIRITSDSSPMIRSPSIPEKRDIEAAPKKLTPTLTITIPKNDDDSRCISSPESTSPLPFSAQNSGASSPQYQKSRQESSREFKRQRSIMDEATTPVQKMQRQDSKWNKVRRAFLTNSAFSVPPSPIRVVSGQAFQNGPGTPKAHSCSGSVEDLEKSNHAASNSQAETRRNYQALRENLGAEFHRKLVEWERLKNTSPRNNPRCSRDSFALGAAGPSTREVLLAEERLAPEFKKKLQDWKRAKKGRRGSATIEQQRVSRRRLTDWQLWRSPSKPDQGRNQDSTATNGLNDGRHHLCEDFVRRMEIWRRVNEASSKTVDSGQRSNTVKKTDASSNIDESEFLALEKVLVAFGDGIDRERKCTDARNLEECFDRDPRIVDGAQTPNCNNEILIRTSMGSYRFEGISREFTRKLYDWEKYRGISPRSSTFRLLAPGYAPASIGETDTETQVSMSTSTNVTDKDKALLDIPKKSKSLGSIEAGGRNNHFPRRFTSLQSLRRLTNKLEGTNRTDASPAPIDSGGVVDVSDDAIMDDSEPEAMIVDIEDVIEETASPLERVQPHQTPVYSVAASETTSIAVPLGTVTSSHEPSPVFLVEVEDNTSRNHWESRSWNQRKAFSSDDSPSPEHFKNRKIWRRKDSLTNDEEDSKDFGEYEPIEWNRESQNFSRDKDSMNSDRSVSSGEYYDTCRSEVLNNVEDGYYSSKREGLSTVSSDGETTSRKLSKKFQVKQNATEGNCSSNLADLHTLVEDIRKSMDLSSEKKDESEFEHEDQEEDQDGTSDDEPNTLGSELKFDDVLQESLPDSLDNCPRPFENIDSTSNGHIAKSSPNLSSNSEQNGVNRFPNYEDCEIIHEDLRHEKLPRLRSKSRSYEDRNSQDLEKSGEYINLSSGYENLDSRIKIRSHLINSTGTSGRNEENVYQNFERFSTSFSHSVTSSTFECNKDPTIRTTPLTLTSRREERSFERIFINEKTLNKVVVPTVNTGNTMKRLSRMNEAPETKHFTDSSDSNRESSVGREATTKKHDSPTRNMLVKTKRMIFSPFRRTEDRIRKLSDTSDDDRTLRPQSKSKSRSSSPKILRQDAILKMPLSLPWPLRSSPKDLKSDAKTEKSLQSKQPQKEKILSKDSHSRRNTITELQHRTSKDESRKSPWNERAAMKYTETDLREARDGKSKCDWRCDEVKKKVQTQKEQQVDASVQATPTEKQNQTPVAAGTPRFRDKQSSEQFGTAMTMSVTPDTLSSDLIHKLNILSNVAARRDGRNNALSVELAPESHSSRVRRAKESFLSRRGGPLCHSLLEATPRSSNPDITRTFFDRYRQVSEPPELAKRNARSDDSRDKIDEARILIREEEAVISEQNNTPIQEEMENSRGDLSNGSRPDLVKSASAGMINVDPDTFGQLEEPTRGCESLPRMISKRRETSGPFAKIVSRLKFPRFMRNKDHDDSRMSTISRLCRQSLFIDVRSEFDEQRESEDESDQEDVPKKNTSDNRFRDAKK